MNFKKFAQPLIASTALLGLTGMFSSCTTMTKVDAKTVHKHEIIKAGGLGMKYVSFPNIIRTGKIASNTTLAKIVQPDYEIDFSKNDALIRALDRIEQSTIKNIKNNNKLSILLKKPTWNEHDRIYWERHVSKMISKEFQETQGLSTYRNSFRNRHISLNMLSSDINNDTKIVEYDCEAMAITEGIVLQKIEDRFLPQPRDNSKLKQATAYYYVSAFCWDKGEIIPEGHAFIMSNATGNIIEPTSTEEWPWQNSPYFVVANKDYSIADFVKGEIAVAVNPETGLVRTYQRTLSGYRAHKALKKYSKETEALTSAFEKRQQKRNTAMDSPFSTSCSTATESPKP